MRAHCLGPNAYEGLLPGVGVVLGIRQQNEETAQGAGVGLQRLLMEPRRVVEDCPPAA
jgi:hypothetical protein